MPRRLGELSSQEKARVLEEIYEEAQAAEWHKLSNRNRGKWYDAWAEKHDLNRTAVKDQIMKGFDAAQHIPPTGEAAVHEKVKSLLSKSKIPYWNDKHRLWGGRAQADFVLGLSNDWLLVTAELESAIYWQNGLMQALWYRSAYFHETNLQVLAGLILFGDCTQNRWEEIVATCTTLDVLLVTFDLMVNRRKAPHALDELLRAPSLLPAPDKQR